MTERALNGFLYAALTLIGGKVEFANKGAGVHRFAVQKLTPDGMKSVTRMSKGGEYYRINCPFCNDNSKRLWVHHTYGMPGVGQDSRPQYHLAHCFNEECEKRPGVLDELRDKVLSCLNGRSMGVTPVEVIETGSLQEVILPGKSLPLAALPMNHKARLYMLSRGYDIHRLSQIYDVRGIVEPPADKWRWMTDNVLIPIVMRGRIVGWQVRYPGDIDFKQANIPKYFGLPGMPKRMMLYNYDAAILYRTVVVVEGVTGVWRVGGPSVAIFGKTITEQQRRMLLEWDTIVLVLDPDARSNMLEEYERLVRMKPGKVVMVFLPEGTDPGTYSREGIWQLIMSAAGEAGVYLDISRTDQVPA